MMGVDSLQEKVSRFRQRNVDKAEVPNVLSVGRAAGFLKAASRWAEFQTLKGDTRRSPSPRFHCLMRTVSACALLSVFFLIVVKYM